MKKLLIITFLALLALPAMATPSIDYNGTALSLAATDETPTLKVWQYLPTGQLPESWQQMLTIHRYPVATVDPKEATTRRAAKAKEEGVLLFLDPDSHVVCFMMADANVVEANAWRYGSNDGVLWGNGFQWRFPKGSTDDVMKQLGTGSPFAKACEELKNWEMKYPS